MEERRLGGDSKDENYMKLFPRCVCDRSLNVLVCLPRAHNNNASLVMSSLGKQCVL